MEKKWIEVALSDCQKNKLYRITLDEIVFEGEFKKIVFNVPGFCYRVFVSDNGDELFLDIAGYYNAFGLVFSIEEEQK